LKLPDSSYHDLTAVKFQIAYLIRGLNTKIIFKDG
jgi:hypothetical protein